MKSSNFWKNKKILITGVTGLIGSWATIYALENGAEVIGFTRGEAKPNSNYSRCKLSEKITVEHGDIIDKQCLYDVCEKHKPDVILHFAGQAIEAIAVLEMERTNATNVLGTLNILECVKKYDFIKGCGCVTSFKEYIENTPWASPYIKSCGCADMLAYLYHQQYFTGKKAITNLVLSNVIGGGDFGRHRLLVECYENASQGQEVVVKTPNVEIPWISVYDVIGAMFGLLEKKMTTDQSEEPNSKPDYIVADDSFRMTVGTVATSFIKYFGQGNLQMLNKDMEFKPVAKVDMNMVNRVYLNRKIDGDKALESMANWYKVAADEDMYEYCKNQLEEKISELKAIEY